VAVRSYAQTTGLWARGLLSREYGVDLDSITWVVAEDGHVAECLDPPNSIRSAPGASITSMLLDSSVDAAIVGRQKNPDPRIVPLIPDHKEQALAWMRRTGIVPVNHMLVLSKRVTDGTPWAVDELWGMLTEARDRFMALLGKSEPENADQELQIKMLRDGYDPLPYGVEALAPTMKFAASLCAEQRLTTRALDIDEIFPNCTRQLR
jgi:4,5-dihydroxyphthalate decarboxylase